MTSVAKIIMLHGRARSGKDTFADTVTSRYPSVMKVAFADKLKELVKDLVLWYRNVELCQYDFENKKSDPEIIEGLTIRTCLQEIGSMFRECIYPQVWAIMACNFFDNNPEIVSKVRERLAFIHEWMNEFFSVDKERPEWLIDFFGGICESKESSTIIFSDFRYPIEYQYVKERYGEASCVMIIRPEVDDELSAVERSHSSENALAEFKFDHTIVNNGPEYLEQVTQLWEVLMR